MRRRFVERRLEIVAERGREGRFVAGQNGDRVDQWRPQIGAAGTQQVAQCLGFRRKPLHFALAFFERQARLSIGPFGLLEPRDRFGVRRASGLRAGASAVGFGLGGAHVRCLGRVRHGRVEARLRFGQLLCAGVGKGGRHFARTRGACLARVPLGEFRCQPFERAFRHGERFVQRSGALFGGRDLLACTRRSGLECFVFLGQASESRRRVGIEFSFARRVLFGLSDALAQRLRSLASACLFGLERLARDDQAVQCGGFLCLDLPQRRKLHCELRL